MQIFRTLCGMAICGCVLIILFCWYNYRVVLYYKGKIDRFGESAGLLDRIFSNALTAEENRSLTWHNNASTFWFPLSTLSLTCFLVAASSIIGYVIVRLSEKIQQRGEEKQQKLQRISKHCEERVWLASSTGITRCE